MLKTTIHSEGVYNYALVSIEPNCKRDFSDYGLMTMFYTLKENAAKT